MTDQIVLRCQPFFLQCFDPIWIFTKQSQHRTHQQHSSPSVFVVRVIAMNDLPVQWLLKLSVCIMSCKSCGAVFSKGSYSCWWVGLVFLVGLGPAYHEGLVVFWTIREVVWEWLVLTSQRHGKWVDVSSRSLLVRAGWKVKVTANDTLSYHNL